jgi:hypothetical protein
MSQSLAKILIHLVFSTKERRPFLRDLAIRDEAHRYLGGTFVGVMPVLVSPGAPQIQLFQS